MNKLDQPVITTYNGVSYYIDNLKYYKIDDFYITKTFVIDAIIVPYISPLPKHIHTKKIIYNETYLMYPNKYSFDTTKRDNYTGELVIYDVESIRGLTHLYCIENLIEGIKFHDKHSKICSIIYKLQSDKMEYINGRKHSDGYKNGIKIE